MKDPQMTKQVAKLFRRIAWSRIGRAKADFSERWSDPNNYRLRPSKELVIRGRRFETDGAILVCAENWRPGDQPAKRSGLPNIYQAIPGNRWPLEMYPEGLARHGRIYLGDSVETGTILERGTTGKLKEHIGRAMPDITLIAPGEGSVSATVAPLVTACVFVPAVGGEHRLLPGSMWNWAPRKIVLDPNYLHWCWEAGFRMWFMGPDDQCPLVSYSAGWQVVLMPRGVR